MTPSSSHPPITMSPPKNHPAHSGTLRLPPWHHLYQPPPHCCRSHCHHQPISHLKMTLTQWHSKTATYDTTINGPLKNHPAHSGTLRLPPIGTIKLTPQKLPCTQWHSQTATMAPPLHINPPTTLLTPQKDDHAHSGTLRLPPWHY
jgi:hypothetical protein